MALYPNGNGPLKLYVGSGDKRYPGYVGVDAVKRAGADIIAPADKIPLPANCADEVMAIHLVEHAHYWEAPDLFREWFRLLKPGGLLVVELPDLVKCCRNIVENITRPDKHPHSLGIFGIFGDYRLRDPWMCHKAGYTFETLRPVVEAEGFIEIEEKLTEFHRLGRGIRDFQLEARKPPSV